jgi:hypothetical protein
MMSLNLLLYASASLLIVTRFRYFKYSDPYSLSNVIPLAIGDIHKQHALTYDAQTSARIHGRPGLLHLRGASTHQQGQNGS